MALFILLGLIAGLLAIPFQILNVFIAWMFDYQPLSFTVVWLATFVVFIFQLLKRG